MTRHITHAGGKSGFTLIELLAVVAILGILAGLAVGATHMVMDNARKTREISSAKQIITAYLLNAADHDDQLMTGYEFGAQVDFPSGDVGSGPEAERYPWRLAPYFNWDAEGIYMINGMKDSIDKMDRQSSEYRYMVSLAPSMGINAYCVGGYRTASRMMCPDDVATRLSQVDNPSSLIAFTSARTKTSGGQSVDIAGNFFVRPPVFGPMKWKSSGFDESSPSTNFGNVDFRHDGAAVVAYLDGHVDLKNTDQLRDMRLWARRADSENYSVNP